MSHFWQNWLRVASVLLILFGAATAMVIVPALAGLSQSFIATVFWPAALADTEFTTVAAFATGLAGAITMGWGTMIYIAVTHGLTEPHGWVRRAIIGGLLVWFLVDNLVSVTLGAYLNVAGNTVLAIAFLLPFLAERQRKHAVA